MVEWKTPDGNSGFSVSLHSVNFFFMPNTLAFISGSEIIIVFFVVLLLFGADKIPDIARTLGKGMKEFRKVTNEIKREFDSSTSDFKTDIEDLKKGIDTTKEDLTGGMRSYIKDSGIEEDIKGIKDNLKG